MHYITSKRQWSAERVRRVCINYGLYTRGTIDNYDHMLRVVENSAEYVDDETIYDIAKDIAIHSEDTTISYVMFILANEAVTTTFKIEETGYYSIRPLEQGSYPTPEGNRIFFLDNFGNPHYIPSICMKAFGYIEYEYPLSKLDQSAYGLVQEVE